MMPKRGKERRHLNKSVVVVGLRLLIDLKTRQKSSYSLISSRRWNQLNGVLSEIMQNNSAMRYNQKG
jgi:hypothetical protein